jgi:hypothetical protein
MLVMRIRMAIFGDVAIAVGTCLLGSSTAARADALVYAYEGNVPPYDPSEGWIVANGGCNGV